MKNEWSQSKDSISGSQNDWVVNVPVLSTDKLFSTFRSHPTIRRVVEGSPRRAGRWNLQRLKNNYFFHEGTDMFLTSDLMGTPKNLIKHKHKGKIINLNPTTLRYVNNTLNLIKLFGPNVFIPKLSNNNKIIVEIGGGYGGECKIANDFTVSHFNVKIGKRWHIFDLDSSIPLISRWLKEFGYEALLNPDPNLLRPISLVISNAAFSEMKRDLQEIYFDNIILPAERGYFIENFNTYSSPYGGFDRAEFINKLKLAGKYVFDLNPREWLSNFDKDAGTGLIVFSDTEISIPTGNLFSI